jgi:hypothetical protein
VQALCSVLECDPAIARNDRQIRSTGRHRTIDDMFGTGDDRDFARKPAHGFQAGASSALGSLGAT